MKKYEYHPASNVFRLLEGEERNRIRESIKQHGQQEPITLYKDQILDGRNRYLCCLDLKVDPWSVTITDKELDGLSPLDFVVIKNDHRRHDDLGQRTISAGKLKLAYEAEAKERSAQNLKKGREIPEPVRVPAREGDSRDRAGAAMGVSGKTADRGARIVEQGAAAVIEAVERGEVSPADADAVADKPKAEQKKALAKVKSGEARTLKAAVDKTEPKHKGGKIKNDPKLFKDICDHLGKTARMLDRLNDVAPAEKFHRDAMNHLNLCLTTVKQWQVAVR